MVDVEPSPIAWLVCALLLLTSGLAVVQSGTITQSYAQLEANTTPPVCPSWSPTWTQTGLPTLRTTNFANQSRAHTGPPPLPGNQSWMCINLSNQPGIMPTSQTSTLTSSNQSVPEFASSEPALIVVAATITLTLILSLGRKRRSS